MDDDKRMFVDGDSSSVVRDDGNSSVLGDERIFIGKSKRRLGWKNYGLFAVLVVVVAIVGALFAGSIFLFNQSVETYDVGAGTFVLTSDYDVVNAPVGGQISKKMTGNYSLLAATATEDKKAFDLGRRAVAYSDSDYKFYLYGVSYLIGRDTSVKKVDNYEEITKGEPSFYKLEDRKYLIADKTIKSKEIGLDENGYLIVDIDRQGNATLVNHKINIKTINPIIIKGTYYDFDVAHEKLIIGDEEIDLTNVVGSSNEYMDPIVENEESEESEVVVEEDNDYTEQLISYYDKYFNKIKTSFNNMYASADSASKTIGNIAQKTNVSLDLTRWTNITKVSTTPSTIILDYNVFDPNNDYSQIFVTISEYGSDSEVRYNLSKENTSFVFRDLLPDRKYSLRYGYTLAKVVDESQAEVTVDNLVVVTTKPKTKVNINKISTNKLHYVLLLDREYAISQAKIRFIVDNVEVASTDYDYSEANDYTYDGSFPLGVVGRVFEVRVTDMFYNGVALDGSVADIYIND